MAGSESGSSETSVHTEPSAGDAYRDAYEPYRTAAGRPEVGAFRRWWLRNPLNALWPVKPNQWDTFQKVAAGVPHAEAVKGGANVRLQDITARGPTPAEVLAGGGFDVEALPSDEAWFGTPDPAIYAAGTNSLTKAQLAEEAAKGSVVTLRQLKQHLAAASDEELELWRKVLMVQRLRDEAFVELPGGAGRVSVWDLWTYIKGNPELKALAERNPNLVAPSQGMTREERIKALQHVAPWKLCANERHMVLPPDVADKLEWGLLAGGSWYSRRPTRWLKGLDGVKDFDFGLYVHEAAAREALAGTWAGRAPGEVLASPAFYGDALRAAPAMGMSLLAVASRPLPLEEVTRCAGRARRRVGWRARGGAGAPAGAAHEPAPPPPPPPPPRRAWEQRMRQQIDRLEPPGGSAPRVLLSTSAATGTGSASETGTASSSEEESGSSSEAAARPPPSPAARPAAPLPAARPAGSPQAAAAVAPPLPPPAPRPAPVQQQLQQAVVQPLPSPPLQQQQAQPQQAQQQQAEQQQQAQAQQAAPARVREVEPRYRGLAQLAGLFDRERLAGTTELLDIRGRQLREGATIMFSAHPSGALLVQAISPGLVKEQRSYLLGAVADPLLTSALLSMFIDPAASLDPEFTAAAGATLLAVTNGYRTGLRQRSAAPAPPGGTPDALRRQLTRHAKWGLPDVGKAPAAQPLLKGVRREVTYQQIEQAFEGALRAAAAVDAPDGLDLGEPGARRALAAARRAAAEAELKQRLGRLGLDVSGLALGADDTPADLLSLARPLTLAAGAAAAGVAGRSAPNSAGHSRPAVGRAAPAGMAGAGIPRAHPGSSAPGRLCAPEARAAHTMARLAVVALALFGLLAVASAADSQTSRKMLGWDWPTARVTTPIGKVNVRPYSWNVQNLVGGNLLFPNWWVSGFPEATGGSRRLQGWDWPTARVTTPIGKVNVRPYSWNVQNLVGGNLLVPNWWVSGFPEATGGSKH
ncbi:hypothetical protein HT031_000298 [Scenedesmus sp. PABB004]|nr:hypothetical protein HT031_000298 [Scenedesmus sp. PABB004]